MISRTDTVCIDTGLEARPVAILVQIAGKFDSNIYFESNGRRVNGKSIMGMMTLGLDYGDEITIVADGRDEEAAVEEIGNYLANK